MNKQIKWCFLVNNVDSLMEFLGKFCNEAMQRGDECMVVFNSKVVEYNKTKFFPKGVRVISKVDWLQKNYDSSKKSFDNIDWKDFFSTFERKQRYLNLNYATSTNIVFQTCQFFDFLFKTEKPDIIVNEAPANIFTSIAYYFCQKYNKKYIGFMDSRINGRMDIFDQIYTCSLYEKTFKTISSNEVSKKDKELALSIIDDFLSHKQLPSNIVYQNELVKSSALARYVKREGKMLFFWLKYLLKKRIPKSFDYETEGLFYYKVQYPFGALLTRLKKYMFKREFKHLDENDNFFLFPLQFYPEASMSVWATYYSDQLNVIKNIAFSLPFPCKLYVKEHPMAQGTRTFNFYNKLKKIPNVVLISPSENNENLIKKSKGVITITSTLGLEAAFIGKPVYLLGSVFYEYHPSCIKINNFSDLKDRINSNMKSSLPTEKLEELNTRFIVSYISNNILGGLYIDYAHKDTNNYGAIYKFVKNKFFNSNKNT